MSPGIRVWYMAIECKEDHPTRDNVHKLPMHLEYVDSASQNTLIVDVLRRILQYNNNRPLQGEIKDVYKLQNIADDQLKEIDINLKAIIREKNWNEFAVMVSGRKTVQEVLRINYASGAYGQETLDCLVLIVEPPSSPTEQRLKITPK
ncbi:hypothetical protein PQX77_005524 [Marasmius sp. AFHP31]|nr:hypothetical protein PQX77_005524 [Marasmius sp. AFHP31]